MARLIANIPERPPNRDIRQLARVLRFLWPYRARMAVAGVALVVAAGCVLVLGQGLKRVVDAGFSGSDAASLDTALFALLAIVCVLALATYAMRQFRPGRDLYAIGSNPEAAALAGVPTGKRVFTAFLISGASSTPTELAAARLVPVLPRNSTR